MHTSSPLFTHVDHGRNIFGKGIGGAGSGCCITKTTTAVIVSTYKTPISAPDCVMETERVADYFISMQL